MVVAGRYLLAAGLLLIALVACIPSRHHETLSLEQAASSVPAKERLSTEWTARTTIPRASRSATTPHTRPAPAPKARTAPTARPVLSGDVWGALAACESGGNPRAVGGGGRYFGAFQFSLKTWQSMGMSGNPVDYSFTAQLSVAQRLQARSGWLQWPHCARVLGLT